MKVVHNVEISVFVREEETNLEQIREKLLSLVDLDLEKENIQLSQEEVTGAEDNKIEILKIKLEKERHVNKFIFDLIGKLSEDQKDMVISQIDSRVDEECNFFIRLDKEKLLNGEYGITDSGNCFHIKFLIAAYPAKKEIAKDIVGRMITSK